jgi:hypothetical protein
MKIYTRVVMDSDLKVIESESFDYEGPIASCDPLTATVVALQVGSQILAGKQARRAGEYQEQQYNIAAGQQQAAAQRAAGEEQRKSRLVQSRALAVAAAGGGGASDPTVVDIIGDLAAEGEYRSMLALYEGDDKARSLRAKGAAAKYEGRAAQRASYLRAGTSALSMYAKYGGGGGGFSGGAGVQDPIGFEGEDPYSIYGQGP